MEPPDPWEALHQADQEIVEVMRRALAAYRSIHTVLDVPVGSILRRLTPDLEAKTDSSGRVVVGSSSSTAPPVQPVSTADAPPAHVQRQLHQHDEQMAAVLPEAPSQPQLQSVPYCPERLQSHQVPGNTVATNTVVGDISPESEDNKSSIMARGSPRSNETLREETSGTPISSTPARCRSPRRTKTRPTPSKSGTPGIHWIKRRNAWQVRKMSSGRKSCREFYIKHYRTAHMDLSVAEQAALDAAIVFQRSMPVERKNVRAGRGIGWDPKGRRWKSFISVKGKTLHGGSFKPKDESAEEMEKARLLAVESRRALEQKYYLDNAAAQ